MKLAEETLMGMISGKDLLCQSLPELIKCKRIELKKHDLIVHAPGFEDRTMAFFEIMVPSSRGSALLLDYRPHNPKNRLQDVRDGFTRNGITVTDSDILVYDRFDPDNFEDRLKSAFIRHGADRIIIDISTMSKLAILLIFNVCLELDLGVITLYAEAQKYGPTQDEFEKAKTNNELHRPSIQIFTAVHGVVRVNSLASVAMQGQPTAALAFMSFNDVLTQALLNTVFPTRLFLINGKPPVHNWREEATAWIHDQLRREWEEDNPVYLSSSAQNMPLPKRTVSTLDYRETVSLLLQLYWQLSATHRIILAPAGSKLQAVGCFIVKALHPDIHIEYPSPEGFLPEYSSGIAQHWAVEFGRLSSLLETITREERREFLELASS
jgi:hypothetical protein